MHLFKQPAPLPETYRIKEITVDLDHPERLMVQDVIDTLKAWEKQAGGWEIHLSMAQSNLAEYLQKLDS